VGRDSSVGIATRYGLGIESRWGARFSTPVQTGPGVHPASYTMGGSFPGVKRPGRCVDRPPHLAPRLKKEHSYTFTSLWACSRVNFTFTFIFINRTEQKFWWSSQKLRNIYISILEGYYIFQVNRICAVGIAIRYGIDGPGNESRWGRDFLYPSKSDPRHPSQLLSQRVPSLSRGKAAGTRCWLSTCF